jgi:hypothetical protein
VNDLGNAVRRNPVSAALIGMGLVWLFSSGKPVQRVTDLAHRTGLDRLPDVASDAFASGRSAIREGTNALGERLSVVGESASACADSATRSVRDSGAAALDRASQVGSEVAHSASDFGRSLPDRGNNLLSSARSNLSTMFHEQPLLLGAIGIAIGAGIAASLPRTEIEAEYLGEASDELRQKATGFISEQSEQVQAMVKDAVDHTKAEAERQGLTPDALKAAAGDVGEKVKRVVQESGDTIRRNAQ